MADTTSTDTEIIKVSEVPLWYRSAQVIIAAGILGLAVSFGLVLQDYYQAETVAGVFQQSRKPILQYRLEKGAWPSNFSFDKVPADVESYDFSAAVSGMRSAEIRGVWRFTAEEVEGRTIPKVIFKADEDSPSVKRILFVTDLKIDDGREKAGKLLVTGTQAEFMLMAE